MGWFNKEEKVPEIPSAPILPELPKKVQEKKNLPELPSFPTNPQNNNLNQEIVKSAVSDSSNGEKEDSTEALNELHVEENSFQNMIPSKTEQSIIPEPPVIKTRVTPMKPAMKQSILEEEHHSFKPSILEEEHHSFKPSIYESNQNRSQIEPIFVRIDKFQSAQKDFEQIKEKVKDIEGVLKKIKEVKSKEEEEINSWTQDIDNLKSRLSEIDSNVFSQM